MSRRGAVVLAVLVGAVVLGVIGGSSTAAVSRSQGATASTAVTGPEWLPLKGAFANGIGCTWNNGCQSPTPGYHGYPAIDFMVRAGTEVFAAGPGVVIVAYRGCPDASSCGPNGSGLGNSVAIRHDNGLFSWYGHLSEVVVEEGWSVAAGDPIGRTGSSGRSTGPHLHYEERSALWVGAVSSGPMLAYHGSRLVSYPGVLKRGAWDAVPCGRQAGEPGCRASHPLRNDGYTVQEATAPKPKPGTCRPQRMGVVFVLDDSGSNADTDPRYLRADAARVALDILPVGTLVSAVNFHNSAFTVLDTTRLTSANRQSIAQQIRASLRTGGGTNYELGFRQALVQLGRMRGVQRIVIFLSDGKPTSGYASDRNIGAQVIPIHTVGYGPVRNLPVLIDIAKRSHPSATYQPIENVAEASNAFATIVHPYQCNKAIGGDNLTLRPNKEYKRSFTVPRNAPGISALATWTHQDAPAVWLRRPDGTTIRPGAGLRVGERVARPGLQVIRFDVSRPAAGRWTLIARSKNWVSLAFDVWRTQTPPVAGKSAATTPPASPLRVGGQTPEVIPFVGLRRVSASWGAPSNGYHERNKPALDIVMDVGKEVYAAGAGEVVEPLTRNTDRCDPREHGGGTAGVSWCIAHGYGEGGAKSGTRITILHPDGRQSRYLHLSRIADGLKVGDRVKAGQLIGYSGNTGISEGPHLHYEERAAGNVGQRVDPGRWIGCQAGREKIWSSLQLLIGKTLENQGFKCLQ